MNTGQDDNIQLLRLPEVKHMTGLSTTVIYEMTKQGSFPRQVKITGRSVAWVRSEVQQWVADRIAADRCQPS